MRFLTSFSAQHNRLVIGLVMGTEIFEFRPYLCLWQRFIFVDFTLARCEPNKSGLDCFDFFTDSNASKVVDAGFLKSQMAEILILRIYRLFLTLTNPSYVHQTTLD